MAFGYVPFSLKRLLMAQINKTLKEYKCKTFVDVSLDIRNPNKLAITVFDKEKF